MTDVTKHLGLQATGYGWKKSSFWLLIAYALFIAMFWGSLASMVGIWMRSDTFAHGFLILPISIWLVWRERYQLATLSPRPTLSALPVICAAGLAWLVARFTDIAVGEQLATVALLISLTFAFLGWKVTKKIAFPLGFLFLAVPMGEDLIPPMMDFTANFTVTMLKLTGVPVFREGTFFEIPSGRWSVVEGCSGVRYLIASITLGVLYAYLVYRSIYRRLIFIAVSVIVPIFANGLRAYMIVMIAHLSDMRLALGVDHLIYGWVFFGIVITLLFWIGSFWREDENLEKVVSEPSNQVVVSQHFAKIMVASLIVLLVWPAWALVSERDIKREPMTLRPIQHPNWMQESAFTDWRPEIKGMDSELVAFYQGHSGQAMLYLAYYNDQREGAEVVNSQNVMVKQKFRIWRQIGRGSQTLEVNGKRFTGLKSLLEAPQQHLLVYHWDWFEGLHSSNDLEIKWHEALARLSGKPRRGAVIVVAAPYVDRPEEAAPVLESFIRDMSSQVELTLQGAGHG